MMCCYEGVCYVAVTLGRAGLLLTEEVHKAKLSEQVDIARKQIEVRFRRCLRR